MHGSSSSLRARLTGLSYDRAILREEEYIHEYTNNIFHASYAAALQIHLGNVADLQERAVAVMMGSHKRLGKQDGSMLYQLDKEVLGRICGGDIDAA